MTYSKDFFSAVPFCNAKLNSHNLTDVQEFYQIIFWYACKY